MDIGEARTHATRALIELRKRILSGTIPAGTRLMEVPVAEMLEISRTPVRDAMSRLVEEGLLERTRSGLIVRRFGFEDVSDAIELRGVLEGTAARLAAERGASTAVLARLVAELETCFVDGAPVAFDRYAEFHDPLAAAPGSDVIRRELARVTRLPFASPSAFTPNAADIASFHRSLGIGQEHHRALVQAIGAREGARAEALAREHARLARHDLEYLRRAEARLPGLAFIVE